MAQNIFQLMPAALPDAKIRAYPMERIERFCTHATSIQFDFTKHGLRINIQD
jgi:hypothetical protein